MKKITAVLIIKSHCFMKYPQIVKQGYSKSRLRSRIRTDKRVPSGPPVDANKNEKRSFRSLWKFCNVDPGTKSSSTPVVKDYSPPVKWKQAHISTPNPPTEPFLTSVLSSTDTCSFFTGHVSLTCIMQTRTQLP